MLQLNTNLFVGVILIELAPSTWQLLFRCSSEIFWQVLDTCPLSELRLNKILPLESTSHRLLEILV